MWDNRLVGVVQSCSLLWRLHIILGGDHAMSILYVAKGLMLMQLELIKGAQYSNRSAD